jgi:hypothetical protein
MRFFFSTAVHHEREEPMDREDCKNERFSARTVGIFVIIASLLLLTVGLIILPFVGFVFGVPLLVLGLALIFAPQSKTCQLIMNKVQGK